MNSTIKYVAVLVVGAAIGGGSFFAFTTSDTTESERTLGDADSISICSFNVQFLDGALNHPSMQLMFLVAS